MHNPDNTENHYNSILPSPLFLFSSTFSVFLNIDKKNTFSITYDKFFSFPLDKTICWMCMFVVLKKKNNFCADTANAESIFCWFYFLMNIQKYFSPLFTRNSESDSNNSQISFYTEFFYFFFHICKIFFNGSALQLTCRRYESFIMTKSLWITFGGKSSSARMRIHLSNRLKISGNCKSSNFPI